MTQNQTPPTSSTSMRALSADGLAVPIAWVEDLFARLAAILGGAMSNVYATANAELVKAEWAEALAGFSAEEVKRGIAATRTRKFAPNLGEFLHLCRPALDPEMAWLEAEQGLKSHAEGRPFAWSHPAVFWAGREVAYELRTSSFGQMRKRWERLLSQQFSAGKWAPVPEAQVKRIGSFNDQFVPQDPVLKARIEAELRDLRKRMTGFGSAAEEQAHRQAQEKTEEQP